MATKSLEQRITALETAVRELRNQMQAKPTWLQKVSGILAHEPEFAKVIEYGRYWRQYGHESAQ